MAIKIIDKNKLKASKESYAKVMREIEILKRLWHHPHITKLYQVMETANSINLVTEFAERGELYGMFVFKLTIFLILAI